MKSGSHLQPGVTRKLGTLPETEEAYWEPPRLKATSYCFDHMTVLLKLLSKHVQGIHGLLSCSQPHLGTSNSPVVLVEYFRQVSILKEWGKPVGKKQEPMNFVLSKTNPQPTF